MRGLLDLAPETATRLGVDGIEQTVRATELAVGDVVLVRPGERIAADGAVVAGVSEVDQATITGEPLPVDKSVGDEVFAGTLNGTESLRVRVDRRPADSVVARIATLVELASRTTITAVGSLTGATPALLTGDNRATAEQLARQIGITDVQAELLPDDKVRAVRELEANGQRVTVVGDGINDAPALAAAHVGIAMGGAGSDLTLQTADAVVLVCLLVLNEWLAIASLPAAT